jgi:hypothetical protein
MSAIIPVNDQFRIELDGTSWKVSKWRARSKHPDGGSWEGVTWHKTLRKAGESLLQRFVAQEELEGVQQVIDAIHASSCVIARAIIQSPYNDSWLDDQDSCSNGYR